MKKKIFDTYSKSHYNGRSPIMVGCYIEHTLHCTVNAIVLPLHVMHEFFADWNYHIVFYNVLLKF